MLRVLLADDSDIMLQAMRKLIAEEPRIKIVGEASTFAQTVQMIASFKPEILVLDLHMAEKRDFAPPLVKAQLACVAHVLAVSFAIDSEAKALAEPTDPLLDWKIRSRCYSAPSSELHVRL